MSRHIASLYIAAADALELGNVDTAAKALRQIAEDLCLSRDPKIIALAEDAENIAENLPFIGGRDAKHAWASELRSIANDFAEAARENDR